MKKVLTLVLAIAMVFSLAACAGQQTEEQIPAKEEVQETETKDKAAEDEKQEDAAEVKDIEPEIEEPVKIATLAGPTGMGLIKLYNDESNKYDIEIYTLPDQLIPKIISGEVDIATIPSNLAAVLYNKTQGAITVLGINTLGVLYILENGDEISTIADLEGKTIVSSGQSASPEYILNNILKENGLVVGENVTVEYMGAHADLSTGVAAGDILISLLPEPFVSITTAKNPDVEVKIDLNVEWKKIYGENIEIPMGVMIVQNTFLEENPQAVEMIMADYAASVDYVNTQSKLAAEDIAQAGIVGSAGIALNAIPRSGISLITGEASKDMLEQYFSVLFESDPNSVGGLLPDEKLYYQQ